MRMLVPVRAICDVAIEVDADTEKEGVQFATDDVYSGAWNALAKEIVEIEYGTVSVVPDEPIL